MNGIVFTFGEFHSLIQSNFKQIRPFLGIGSRPLREHELDVFGSTFRFLIILGANAVQISSSIGGAFVTIFCHEICILVLSLKRGSVEVGPTRSNVLVHYLFEVVVERPHSLISSWIIIPYLHLDLIVHAWGLAGNGQFLIKLWIPI